MRAAHSKLTCPSKTAKAATTGLGEDGGDEVEDIGAFAGGGVTAFADESPARSTQARWLSSIPVRHPCMPAAPHRRPFPSPPIHFDTLISINRKVAMLVRRDSKDTRQGRVWGRVQSTTRYKLPGTYVRTSTVRTTPVRRRCARARWPPYRGKPPYSFQLVRGIHSPVAPCGSDRLISRHRLTQTALWAPLLVHQPAL